MIARSRHAGAHALWLVLLVASCGSRGGDATAVKATIQRYDELLRDGYERQNMSFLREVASEEQARRLYHHMAALGEGNLRLSSTLRSLEVVRIELPARDEARAETREVWDFTQYRIATGEKFLEEEGFVYRLAYALRRSAGKWIVTGVDVLSGEPARTPVPPPEVDRGGGIHRPDGPAPARPR